jgi:hypothetical protein
MVLLRSFLAIFFSCVLAHAGEKPGPQPLLSAEDLEAAGILVWEYSLPADLNPGEFATLRWRIADPSIKVEQLESGLDLKGIPAGINFKIMLWTGEFFLEGEKGERCEPEGVRFCISYRKSNGKLSSRHGIMKFPKGWSDFYGYLPSQAPADLDSGLLLMLYNPEKEGTNAALAFLDLVYEYEASGEVPKKAE